MTRSQALFERDIRKAAKSFPGLSVKGNIGNQFLKGILDITNADKHVIYSYSIEVRYSEGYPYRFPKLYEVGGDIPIGCDWHKYSDNSLCLDVEADEIIKCHRGLPVIDFLKEVAIPHLANQRYRSITGQYVDEYRHGGQGIREYYGNLFKTADEKLWIMWTEQAFSRKSVRRNDLCHCGSGLKYKHCHEAIDAKLQLIGTDRVWNDFKTIGIL